MTERSKITQPYGREVTIHVELYQKVTGSGRLRITELLFLLDPFLCLRKLYETPFHLYSSLPLSL